MNSEGAADITEANRAAWNAARYEAWRTALGAPAEEALRLRTDPEKAARRILPHLGSVAGKRICNVQGSHGRLAVSLALLGAHVTVIDFAEDNRRYAAELASAAQVGLDLSVTDNLLVGTYARYADVDSDIEVDGHDVGEAEIDPMTIGAGVTYRF